VVVPGFIISELRTAFQMGFLLFIPFILIDLVVATVLMSLGMFMMPPMTISLPLKVLLFVLVDGWLALVVEGSAHEGDEAPPISEIRPRAGVAPHLGLAPRGQAPCRRKEISVVRVGAPQCGAGGTVSS
jgi:hypothetical protein